MRATRPSGWRRSATGHTLTGMRITLIPPDPATRQTFAVLAVGAVLLAVFVVLAVTGVIESAVRLLEDTSAWLDQSG